MTQHFEHQCPHCTYSSRTEGRLKRHIKDFHSNEDSIYTGQHKVKSSAPKRKCRYCQFYTYDQVEFWVHLKKHIKPEKLLECPHCEFVTELKHHLEYHIRVHIGSKPFKCPKCNYSCVNKSMLNSHMKSHTNVYQFRCRDCNYATKYSHSLKLHLIKKKHLADVVLNSDGSLPADGTGHFDSINRRGPPRGPRTMKKSKGMENAFAMGPHLSDPFKFLTDPRMQFAAKQSSDDYYWNDPHRSRSPSETSTTSKDENMIMSNKPSFPPLPGLYSVPPALPARPPPVCLPRRLFDCSFCIEKFTTPIELKCHVEETHYRDLMIFKFNQPKQSSPFLKNLPIKNENSISSPTKSELQEEVVTSVNNVALDLSNASKRKLDEDKDSGHADSPFSVHSSPDSNVKKRARKGRAFKLLTENSDQPDEEEVCNSTSVANHNNDNVDKNVVVQKEEKRSSPPLTTTSTEQNRKLMVDSSWHICRHCEMAFADQMTHRLHMGYHGYFNPFQCNGCGENCVDAFDFMLHLMSKAHN
ncbi:hypothetical protein HELRODRAFT_116286 [Helobdella robusta]|uniref:Hunchback-like n=1 Tax=Helobdella robusta TaxID=6412 RepID=T1EGE0_HELRO|nr:hypothetical protein HELRODRAFT_116286 [Helobdella robusta]ESN91932.1 hypothetical protein HELRODRAFT_116286 [Helobdella robusta]